MTTQVDKIADWFINRVDRDSGEAITHLKLQKLLYFAQAWHLANKGEPLFDAEFQAWAHGPVTRPIYDRFKGQGWDALEAVDPPKLSKKVENYLEKVFETYGKYGAKYLERLTHKHAPWIEARGDAAPEERCETVISKKSMRDYYGQKIGKDW
ncbi:MAG TPA: type II toxin-antitoxin system antitoxin SocA domain-containing protein [Devosia sp.]|jgi:uncharacterized phage-associated protein